MSVRGNSELQLFGILAGAAGFSNSRTVISLIPGQLRDGFGAGSHPSGFSSDPFTDVLRDGARKLIEQAIQEVVLLAVFQITDKYQKLADIHRGGVSVGG